MCLLNCVDHVSIIREVELKEARAEIHRLTEHVDSLKKLLKRKKDSMRQVTLKRHFDWPELLVHLP